MQSGISIRANVLTEKNKHYQFTWLDSEIKNNNVLFPGESHWMVDVNKVITDLILYANSKDYFATLVLEVPFSATAFINAYLEADSSHQRLLLPMVQPYFKATESIQLLKTLKAWNNNHPYKKISTPAPILNRDFSTVLNTCLIPILKLAAKTG